MVKHGPFLAHPTHPQPEASPTPELQVLLRIVLAELRCPTERPFHTRLFPTSTLGVQLKECRPPSSSPTCSCSSWTWTSPLDKQTLVLTGIFLAFKEFILMHFFRIFSFTCQLHSLLAGTSFSPVSSVTRYLSHVFPTHLPNSSSTGRNCFISSVYTTRLQQILIFLFFGQQQYWHEVLLLDKTAPAHYSPSATQTVKASKAKQPSQTLSERMVIRTNNNTGGEMHGYSETVFWRLKKRNGAIFY